MNVCGLTTQAVVFVTAAPENTDTILGEKWRRAGFAPQLHHQRATLGPATPPSTPRFLTCKMGLVIVPIS